MGCVFWSFVEFSRIFGKFQKLLGGVEGPPGDSCLKNPFSGFFSMHRLTARCCPPGDTNWLA